MFDTQAARPGESCNSVWALLRLEVLQWQHSSQEQAERISGRVCETWQTSGTIQYIYMEQYNKYTGDLWYLALNSALHIYKQ